MTTSDTTSTLTAAEVAERERDDEQDEQGHRAEAAHVRAAIARKYGWNPPTLRQALRKMGRTL